MALLWLQCKDQSWQTAGNAALKLACQQQTSVRVVRAVPG